MSNILLVFIFSRRRKTDWSQVVHLETLIGSRALYSDHVLLLWRCLFSGINGSTTFMVLAWQVGPFHLTLTQINSEMNCIAKNECPESQKLDTRGRLGENLNTRHVSNPGQYFCILVFDLFYVRQEKHQKILLSF